jgi:hypothetical protein
MQYTISMRRAVIGGVATFVALVGVEMVVAIVSLGIGIGAGLCDGCSPQQSQAADRQILDTMIIGALVLFGFAWWATRLILGRCREIVSRWPRLQLTALACGGSAGALVVGVAAHSYRVGAIAAVAAAIGWGWAVRGMTNRQAEREAARWSDGS